MLRLPRTRSRSHLGLALSPAERASRRCIQPERQWFEATMTTNPPRFLPRMGSRKTTASAMQEVADLYTADGIPWVIGYSGGKDSTAALQLVWLALEKIPVRGNAASRFTSSAPIHWSKIRSSRCGFPNRLNRMSAVGQTTGAAFDSPPADAKTRKHVLGQPDWPGVSCAAAKIPMVYGTSQDHALHRFHQDGRARTWRGRSCSWNAQGGKRDPCTRHEPVRGKARARPSEPERRPAQFVRIHPARGMDQR